MNLFFNKKQNSLIKMKKSPKGFTLVELMISVAVFSSAVVIGVGALYSAQQINIKLQSTRTIIDSLSISFEVMVRNMRYGSVFYCVDDSDSALNGKSFSVRDSCEYDVVVPGSGGSQLFFNSINGERVHYYVDGITYRLMESMSTDGINYTPRAISSDDVKIDKLRFYVTGAESVSMDKKQPMVTMVISGQTKIIGNSPSIPFVLQTTITTRNAK